jgi:hypothetical protein
LTGCAGTFQLPFTTCARTGTKLLCRSCDLRNLTAQRNRGKVRGLTDLAIAHAVDAVERGRLHARLRQESTGQRVKTHNQGRYVAPRTRAQAPHHKSGVKRRTEPPAKSWAVSFGILGKCILGKPMSMFMDGNCAESNPLLRTILQRELGRCAERRTHGGRGGRMHIGTPRSRCGRRAKQAHSGHAPGTSRRRERRGAVETCTCCVQVEGTWRGTRSRQSAGRRARVAS